MTIASRRLRRPFVGRAAREPVPGGRIPLRRRIAAWLVILVVVLLVWEGAKWLFGDPWRIHGTVLGIAVSYEHVPPLTARIASDLALPHVWDVLNAYLQPTASGNPLWLELLGAALFTLREAVVGLVVGGLVGLVLGIVFVHSRLLERSLVPYVVASQTIPILAIAPIVVVTMRAGWLSVAVIAVYLTFFPVTIATLRGLRAFDPRAGELMRSYAASPRQVLWKLRLPAAVPYLFPAFRISASASVVGAIIGELPSGIPEGLGGQILNYNQYYTSAPWNLWATVVASALLGLAFVGVVRLAEALLTRGRYRPAA